jgi:hypothetical protein
MANKEQDALRKKFDEFSSHLEARVREFKERGTFSDADEAGSREIRGRLEAIQRKLEGAIAGGETWGILKYDLDRDFSAVTEAFTSFGERLDAEAGRLAADKPRGKS